MKNIVIFKFKRFDFIFKNRCSIIRIFRMFEVFEVPEFFEHSRLFEPVRLFEKLNFSNGFLRSIIRAFSTFRMLFQLVSKSSNLLISRYLRAFLDFVCGSAFCALYSIYLSVFNSSFESLLNAYLISVLRVLLFIELLIIDKGLDFYWAPYF